MCTDMCGLVGGNGMQIARLAEIAESPEEFGIFDKVNKKVIKAVVCKGIRCNRKYWEIVDTNRNPTIRTGPIVVCTQQTHTHTCTHTHLHICMQTYTYTHTP